MLEPIGPFDIHVSLHLSPLCSSGEFIEKRWDIRNSPFASEIWDGRPGTNTEPIFFSNYPHTGDTCRLIFVARLKLFLEFTAKTTLTPGAALIRNTGDFFLYGKEGTKVEDGRISLETIVEALLEDGWTRF